MYVYIYVYVECPKSLSKIPVCSMEGFCIRNRSDGVYASARHFYLGTWLSMGRGFLFFTGEHRMLPGESYVILFGFARFSCRGV